MSSPCDSQGSFAALDTLLTNTCAVAACCCTHRSRHRGNNFSFNVIAMDQGRQSLDSVWYAVKQFLRISILARKQPQAFPLVAPAEGQGHSTLL